MVESTQQINTSIAKKYSSNIDEYGIDKKESTYSGWDDFGSGI